MAAESAQPTGATAGRADRREHGGTGPAGPQASAVTGSAWLSGRTRRASRRRPVRDRTPVGLRVVCWLNGFCGDVAGGVLYSIARHYVGAGAILVLGSVLIPRPLGVWVTLWGGVLYSVAIGYGVGRIWARLDGRRSPGTDGVVGAGLVLPADVSGSAAPAPLGRPPRSWEEFDEHFDLNWSDPSDAGEEQPGDRRE
jgi:hypothetical protein